MARGETRKSAFGAGAIAGLWTLPPWPARIGRDGWLAAAILHEREARRPFLFVPIGMMGGVLLFFAADREPALWAGPVLFVLAAGAAWFCWVRHLTGLMVAALALTAIAAGFSGATIKSRLVAAPVIEKAQGLKGTGVILQNDRRGTGARLLLGIEAIHGKPQDATPKLVRVTTRAPLAVEAGTRIDFAAYVLPPPQPSRPGGYDFARDAWFAGIGGVGSLQGQPIVTHDQAIDRLSWRLLAAIDRARNAVTARIASVIGGQAGEVAAALITGKRGGINEDTNDSLRAAGIYHVVSISGLHMVLAAGMIFVLVRVLFALSPAALLTLPVKSIAAITAILAAIAYDIFAGSEIATERSLVMTMIVFGAVLVHRRAISMRNLALAAIILIVFEPETVVGPSFQMSFCAVMGLVALYERSGIAHAAQEGAVLTQAELPTRERPPEALVGRVLGWISKHAMGLVLTTLVAEMTTAPFGLYHFQQLQPLGLLGNALVLPLISIVVMPAALLGMIALPFGLDAWVWMLMGWGVDLMLWLASLVAAIPFSVLAVPAPSGWAMALVVFGLIWLALWTSILRWAGAPLLILGFALAWSGPRPDLYAAADGKAVAIRGADGKLALVGPSPGRFSLEQWLRADGDAREADDPTLKAPQRCDRAGCILVDSRGSAISFIKQASAFDEDCQRAALIITSLKAPTLCAAAVLDAQAFRISGAVAGYQTKEGAWRFEGVRTPSTDRPWRPRSHDVDVKQRTPREDATPRHNTKQSMQDIEKAQ